MFCHAAMSFSPGDPEVLLVHILTFPMTLQIALLWCLVVQEVAMLASWPASALSHWDTQKDRGHRDGSLLFRGPR